MAPCRILVVVFAVTSSHLLGFAADGASAPPKRTLSKHISDEVLAGFRKGDPEPVPPTADEAVPAEPDPEVLVLPAVQVVEPRPGGGLTQEVVTPKTEATPVVAGTGVTEYNWKGRKILVRRILFIPVAFKLEW